MNKACILFCLATILGSLIGSPGMPLRTPAHVIGEESRVRVTEGYKAMGLDTVDMLRIRQSTGFVICPGTVHGNPSRTSGALVHDGRVLVTNSHSFVDKKGQRREPLNECYFKTQGVVPEIQYLDFSEGNYDINDNWMANENVNDFAVVRLRGMMTYARAFPIAPASETFEGRSFILVSAKPRSPGKPFPEDEPVVQVCGIRKVFPATFDYGTVYYGDCDLTNAGSGSIGLVMVNGRLNALSVASGSGEKDQDGQPYNESTGSISFHTPIKDNLLNAIMRLSK